VSVPFFGERVVCPLGLAGPHQGDNAALAVAVLEDAARRGLPITPAAVREGLATVSWPGRLERLGAVLLDGAHNPDGVDSLLRALPSALPEGPSALVFGCSNDKPWQVMLDALAQVLPPSRWVLTAATLPRAVPPEVLAAPSGAAWAPTVPEALALARAHGGVTLVCGSLHLVAAARACLLGLPEEPRVSL
jgi:dihydrofolate synthase/folylpolyglutamate synthase